MKRNRETRKKLMSMRSTQHTPLHQTHKYSIWLRLKHLFHWTPSKKSFVRCYSEYGMTQQLNPSLRFEIILWDTLNFFMRFFPPYVCFTSLPSPTLRLYVVNRCARVCVLFFSSLFWWITVDNWMVRMWSIGWCINEIWNLTRFFSGSQSSILLLLVRFHVPIFVFNTFLYLHMYLFGLFT